MSPIVSNATPLIYLAKVRRLDLLRKAFGEVFIPEEVKVEVVDKGKALGETDAFAVEKALDDGWLRVLRAEPLETPIRLQAGEAGALSLARKLAVREVLVDDVSARTAARLLGLTPRGTVFVLLKALELRELNLDGFLELLNQLIRHGFRLREEVYVEAIRKAREIAEKSRSSTDAL